MTKLQGKSWMGHDLKLGWGKAVPNVAQQQPIHVPERLKWFLNPPKPSKLPLNAQPPGEINEEKYGEDRISECTGFTIKNIEIMYGRYITIIFQYEWLYQRIHSWFD